MDPGVSPMAVTSGDANDAFAASLRGFGPVGILAILGILSGNLVVVPLTAILVLLWAHRSRTPWSQLGYVRPTSWVRTVAAGAAFGIAFKLLMKMIVMPLLGADPINHAFHYLAGNRAALPGIIYAVTIGAGFGEETLFRGFLFERVGKLFGTSAIAKVSIVILTSALFGMAHYSLQGWAGVEQATIVGLVFGTFFMVTGRIWPIMIAHAAFDLTAVAIIYNGLESKLGRYFFG